MIETDRLKDLLRTFNSPDASERRSAASDLADADERALYPLIKALRDEHPGVQDAAMRSIIAIGGEIAAYMTLPLLREDAYLRNTSRIILKQVGEAAVPLLRPLFKDKDDDIRIFAVDLIGEIGSCGYPQDAAQLLESDPNPNVRSSAARTLSRLDHRQSILRLQSALDDEEWVCISALEALAAFRDETAVGRITGLLDHPSESVRYAAIEALGNIGSTAGSDALLARLQNAADFEKGAIVQSLVQIGITPSMTGVYQILLDTLKTGEWNEKVVALRGLAKLGDPRAVRSIVDIAGTLDPSDPESEERIASIQEALAEFGCSREILEVVEDPSVKFRGKVLAIQTLAALQCREAVPVLIKLMEGNLREVRRACASALGEMNDADALEALRDGIEDRDGHVRYAAAAALGRIGDIASFDPLFRHVPTERYRDVQDEMVRALLLIDEPALSARISELGTAAREIVGRYARDERTVLALSNDPASGVKLAALAGLGNFPTDAAIARLTTALQENDAEVRKAAIASLAARNAGYDAVLPLLRDPDTWVRLSAATALGQSGRTDLIEPLAALLEDPEPPVAFAALEAISRIGGSGAVSALSSLKHHPNADLRERAGSILETLA